MVFMTRLDILKLFLGFHYCRLIIFRIWASSWHTSSRIIWVVFFVFSRFSRWSLFFLRNYRLIIFERILCHSTWGSLRFSCGTGWECCGLSHRLLLFSNHLLLESPGNIASRTRVTWRVWGKSTSALIRQPNLIIGASLLSQWWGISSGKVETTTKGWASRVFRCCCCVRTGFG